MLLQYLNTHYKKYIYSDINIGDKYKIITNILKIRLGGL